MRKSIFKYFILVTLVFGMTPLLCAQPLPASIAEYVEMSSEKLNQIDGLVMQAIAEKKMPGAVVLVGRRGKIVFKKAYGNRSLMPNVEKMTIDTIFDLASLTKPVATATSIMILIEQGKLRLSDTIGDFIPDIDDPEAKKITVQQLLTHTSGYRPDFDLGERWTGREGMLAALKREKLQNQRGTKFVYSDIGFIVLGEIVERVSKSTLDGFVKKKHLSSFPFSDFIRQEPHNKMPNAGILYPEWLKKIAPTENVCGQQSYLGGKPSGGCDKASEILRGEVHDPTSHRMWGVAGHAGLFSTADDLAKYCQMLLNGGILDGKRLLSPSTVALMTKPNVISEKGETRGLGWDIDTSFSSNRGELFPLGSFGHTGFTGTGIWIDPLSETFVIFLSNRVHPDGKGNIVDVRAKVSTVAASAIMDITPGQIRDLQSQYYSEVAAQLANWQAKARVAERDARAPSVPAVVLNGIDVLENENFKSLDGMKIGLVTNHTGINRAGKSTIDVLNEAKNLKLTSLFSPEHGIRGELDQAKINDSMDEKTGLPIYSLYGESRRPKPEQFKDLDAVVFDIQDIGTRFYTYISTLRYVMEEAAKAKVKVFVLDRPNPINGIDIEGPIADEEKLSFVAPHTIPVRHGLTVGELALLMNAERKITTDLSIVKMEGWKRAMWFDETNQTWVNPSPNMRSLTEAILYPGIGLLETTNLSVGRGTDTPFEIIGAPWIDGQKLAFELNGRNLHGVRFVPVRFKPNASKYKDEVCGGVNIVVTSRSQFEPLKTGYEIAKGLRKLFTAGWDTTNLDRLLVNGETLESLLDLDHSKDIFAIWNDASKVFIVRRSPYLLYR